MQVCYENIYPCFLLLKETQNGLLQLMHVSGQLNRKNSCFQLLKQIMDRDVKVSFETFYDVIFVSMLSKTLHDLNFLKVGNILHFLREF